MIILVGRLPTERNCAGGRGCGAILSQGIRGGVPRESERGGGVIPEMGTPLGALRWRGLVALTVAECPE